MNNVTKFPLKIIPVIFKTILLKMNTIILVVRSIVVIAVVAKMNFLNMIYNNLLIMY